MVVRAGWANTGQALLELADVGVDSEIKSSVRKAAKRSLVPATDNTQSSTFPDGGIDEVEIRDIQGVKAGQNYLMEVELAVPQYWTIQQTRIIEDAVRLNVGSKVRGVRRVKVRMVPKEGKDQDFANEFIGADVSPRSSPEPEDEAEANHKYHRKH